MSDARQGTDLIGCDLRRRPLLISRHTPSMTQQSAADSQRLRQRERRWLPLLQPLCRISLQLQHPSSSSRRPWMPSTTRTHSFTTSSRSTLLFASVVRSASLLTASPLLLFLYAMTALSRAGWSSSLVVLVLCVMLYCSTQFAEAKKAPKVTNRVVRRRSHPARALCTAHSAPVLLSSSPPPLTPPPPSLCAWSAVVLRC